MDIKEIKNKVKSTEFQDLKRGELFKFDSGYTDIAMKIYDPVRQLEGFIWLSTNEARFYTEDKFSKSVVVIRLSQESPLHVVEAR